MKNILVWNHKAWSLDILYEASPSRLLPRLFKLCPKLAPHQGSHIWHRLTISNFNKIVTDIDIDSNTPDSWDCQKSNYLYPSAGHVITGNLNVIPDARVRNVISKGPKYRFPSNIDFLKCRREIAASLNDFSNSWCKRENVEPDALKECKIIIFKIIDTRISFYSRNTHLLPL